MNICFGPRLSRYASFNVLRHLTKKNHNRFVNLNESTLTGRLLNFVARPIKYEIASQHVIQKQDIDRKTNEVINSIQMVCDSNNFNKFVSLDRKCANEVHEIKAEHIMSILNLYMRFIPNQITESEFYKSSMNQLDILLPQLNTFEVLQFMFYIGLLKKQTYSKYLLKRCFQKFTNDDISNLSVEDACVICNSTFKTSTRIENMKLLNKIIDILNENLYIIDDPALFVTFIKSLRHNHFINENILNTISCTILFNSTYKHYSLSAICHILAAFADYQYYDDVLFKLLQEQAVNLMKAKDEPKMLRHDIVRTKDVNRFLWIFSTLGQKLDRNVICDVIVPIIEKDIENQKYEHDVELLIESVFYMWIMEYQALDLIKCALTPENLRSVYASKKKTKYRLNTLLTSIQLENPNLYKAIGFKQKQYVPAGIANQIGQRPQLERVLLNLRLLGTKLDVAKFECEYQIPHLKILGITGYRKNIYKSMFVEVLDDFVNIKNASVPSGLMQLKLRLLKYFDVPVISILAADIEDLTEIELQDFLMEEVELICG